MATQNFDVDTIAKIKGIDEELTETLGKMIPAAEATVELARKSGSDKFLKEAEGAVEGATAVVKQYAELSEILQGLVKKSEALNAALN